ncbi:ATP-binding cassette domain-containing protein [Cronobacter sakazakii]|uniref:ABC transporter ATP-binding protein n=1 Tax=Enterobacteriaceae TaxID=543 RepID=UPI0009D66533|nr:MULTISPECIES: ATP-binding cassette domain-containing protein [Enterobacteriaceae]HBC0020144.1 ATP-binding cassette domain-containing protein [Enterobacter hormaechei subsp. steigerwaltii]MBJ9237196.1 ATP-binding cassette domain-containing protein [Citrobacter koseri]SSI08242.1 nickel transport ATP-binding protein NikE [Klebsiella pneumoniae]SSL10763.1 nickel transport ATP-binding protein NikE [Klebsiella pneumoniae]HDY9012849.1 ATP-binding cassette domain-containing protein [Klebsiella pneu
MQGLVASDVVVEFRRPGGQQMRILDRVDLIIPPGKIVGLTGPSGRGKTTLGRVMAGLVIPTAGRVICNGIEVKNVRTRSGAATRGKIGMVFQSPRRSCDPRLTLKKTIMQTARPDADIEAILARVVLTPDLLNRYPGQVSDGQLQRAAMARTLATKPDFMILDEMSSMLDPATTATLMDAVKQFVNQGGGVLMISHDHELVDAVSDELRQL